jgi:RAB protein geranylgeranyltransferase component A
VLHVDCNDYYGGPEAAFSLQEAEAWVEKSAGKLQLYIRYIFAEKNKQQLIIG